MNDLKKILGIGISGLCLWGYLQALPSLIEEADKEYRKPKYINGTVLKESGTIVNQQKIIERSEGALFGNDSVRIGNHTYAIQFKTDKGKNYTFQIDPSPFRRENKIEALNLAISKGTKIRIKRFDFYYNLVGSVGRVLDTDIEVLD